LSMHNTTRTSSASIALHFTPGSNLMSTTSSPRTHPEYRPCIDGAPIPSREHSPLPLTNLRLQPPPDFAFSPNDIDTISPPSP
jgi:hypothetical protein